MIRILKVEEQTISDGLGLRMSIYFSGCSHACVGCHNKLSWNPNIGHEVTEEKIKEIVSKYKANPLLSGITFTGGDPLYNIEAFTEVVENIVKLMKQENLNFNLWLYTGYDFEEIKQLKVLEHIDVVVDGKFVQKLFNPSLLFKGSSNQRIIDVRKSIKEDRIYELL